MAVYHHIDILSMDTQDDTGKVFEFDFPKTTTNADEIARLVANGCPRSLALALLPVKEYAAGITSQTVTDYGPSNKTAQRGATAGAEASDPTWATSGLTFDGGDYALTAAITLTHAGPWTMFFVGKPSGTAGVLCGLGVDADNYQLMQFNGAGKARFVTKATTAANSGDLDVEAAAVQCLVARSGTSITLQRMDTAESVTVTNKSPTGSPLGCLGADPAAGEKATALELSAFVVCSAILTDEEVVNFYGWLKGKCAYHGVACL